MTEEQTQEQVPDQTEADEVEEDEAESIEDTPPVKSETDPLIEEYASDLREQIGTAYTDEIAALPLRQRITAMKAVKRAIAERDVTEKGESKTPKEPEPEHKVKFSEEYKRQKYKRSKPKIRGFGAIGLKLHGSN